MAGAQQRATSRLAVAGAAVTAVAATAAGAASFVASSRVPVQPKEGPAGTEKSLRGASLTSRGLASDQGQRAPSAALSLAGLAGAGAGIAFAAGRRRATRAVAGRTTRASTATATVERTNLAPILPDCPRTIWQADDIDLDNLPPVQETAPLIVNFDDVASEVAASGSEEAWFQSQKLKIKEQVQRYGAIWFRGFKSTRDASGFRTFYESLQLNPCLDPIHTSGLRDMIEKKDAVYEAVNKPSLAQHYVGLHNESTYVKTAMFGAFVCFKPASEGGGEFLLADGAKILKDMDPAVLKRIYERKVRISVSNLDLNFLGALPDGLREPAQDFLQDLILKAVAPKFDMDLEMVFGADKSNPYRLQAIEHTQPPINRHPVTGQTVWFCNLHNHSRYLRDRRPCTVPEVGMTDVYHGDLSTIDFSDVQHINSVCEKNIVPMLMKEGDVVLLDNYRVLHGRDVFKGERKHAVTWFESWGEPLKRNTTRERPDDFMNQLINKTLV